MHSAEILAHQMLDDYVSMVGNFVFPSEGHVESLGLESHRSTALGYLRSPLRRPTVWEDWSPKEIAIFEAALMQHGKEFSLLAKKYLPKKSCKEVVAFYYAWKKTRHYQQWKSEYEPDDGAWVMMDEKTNGSSKPSTGQTNSSGTST